MEGANIFDGAVAELIQAHFHNAVTDAVFPVITYFGEMGLFWLLIALGMIISKKLRRTGLMTVLALAVTCLVGEIILKNIVCRPRPFVMFPEFANLLVPAPKGYSFPSGHTASSFAASTVIFKANKKWGIAAFVFAAFIGFSRIFLFVHWTTDVLFGAVMGVLLALVSMWAFKKIAEKREQDEKELAE